MHTLIVAISSKTAFGFRKWPLLVPPQQAVITAATLRTAPTTSVSGTVLGTSTASATPAKPAANGSQGGHYPLQSPTILWQPWAIGASSALVFLALLSYLLRRLSRQ